MIDIVFSSFSEPSCPMDGGVVILEKVTPIRIEKFHHKINMFSQRNLILTCNDASLKEVEPNPSAK